MPPMETVPLADQPCHRAGISINDFGGGVYLSRWPPSVTTVVQPLPNENDPVVLPPPCQAPATSTGETAQPLLSQRVPSAFLPCVHGHPVLLPQLLLLAPRKKTLSRCRHFTSVVLHFVASIFALNLLPLLASALLRYRKARLPQGQASAGDGAEVDESGSVHCDVSAELSTEEQSTTRRGPAYRLVAD